MKDIISANKLTKTYQIPIKQGVLKSIFFSNNRELIAVDKIDFKVKQGESVALLGPNGAGKTTTLKMLTGLLYPTSGEIEVLGFTPTDRKREFLRQIALVMGNKSGLSWDLSAMQSFNLFKTIYQIPENILKNRLDEMTELLDIKDQLDTPIRKLSLGQRLKMELIGAILHRPKLLFLDEPTIGLDVVSKRKIRGFLRYLHKEEQTTILLTSHEMADIESVCDRAIIINHGQIVFDDTLEKLSRYYQDKKYLTVTFKKPVKEEKLQQLGNVISSRELSHTLEISKSTQSTVIAKLAEKFPVDDIDIQGVPLDEIIEDLFTQTK